MPSSERRTERKKERERKTQSIGSIYIDLKSLPDMSAKGQVKGEREKQINANEQ